ncbi:hypothetical protein NMY22_g3397 [Coprinellus aureogranulatus]|nr:hypothetical protein NMY22_g3397 [Coprinellus aureogranulatus]
MSDNAQDDAATRIQAIFLSSIKASYGVVHIDLISLTIHWMLCIYTFYHFKSTKSPQDRGMRLPYLIFSFATLALYSYVAITDSVYVGSLAIGDPSENVQKWVHDLTVEEPWWGIMNTISQCIINLLAEGLLVYRCYIIWNDPWNSRRWPVIIPCLALVASIAMAIFYIVVFINSQKLQSRAIYITITCVWMSVSVSVNVISTALIVGKLTYERWKLSKVLAKGHLVKYSTAATILIESATPLAIIGIIATIALTRTSNQLFTQITMSLWGGLSVICPQLIIFRVAAGRAYTTGDLGRASGPELVSQPIHFTGLDGPEPHRPGDSESVSDVVDRAGTTQPASDSPAKEDGWTRRFP